MFITDRLLFIHIPKNGGTSVREHLAQNLKGTYVKRHLTYDQAINHFPDLKEKVSFCIVRNPFDRFVSIYRMNNQENRLKKVFGKEYLIVKNKIDTFDKFIKNFQLPKNRWFGNNIFTPQKVWANNVDYIFKLEEPERLIKFLKSNGVKGNLPLLNNRETPSWKNKFYQKFYNSQTKKIIEEKFLIDLREFNYEF